MPRRRHEGEIIYLCLYLCLRDAFNEVNLIDLFVFFLVQKDPPPPPLLPLDLARLIELVNS